MTPQRNIRFSQTWFQTSAQPPLPPPPPPCNKNKYALPISSTSLSHIAPYHPSQHRFSSPGIVLCKTYFDPLTSSCSFRVSSCVYLHWPGGGGGVVDIDWQTIHKGIIRLGIGTAITPPPPPSFTQVKTLDSYHLS